MSDLGQLVFVSVLEVQPTQIKLGQLTMSCLLKYISRTWHTKSVETLTEKARATWSVPSSVSDHCTYIWPL